MAKGRKAEIPSGGPALTYQMESVGDDDITHATVWGACDEDLYRWTLREADRIYGAGSPFHFFVMTTSNHRPYTYPDGRIDIPSGSGREGAVK